MDATSNRPLPTFSSLRRAFACAASTVLPLAEEQSAAAAQGTARHAFIHRVSDLLRAGTAVPAARELALAEAPEAHRFELALIPVQALRLQDTVAEVAFAIDSVTGEARVLGRGIDRQYDQAGRKPTEFCGALDRVGRIGQEGVYVGDLKGRSHDRRPEEDEQLLAGAYAACRVARRRWAEIEVIRIVDGRTFPKKVRVAAQDLDRFAVRLRQLGDRIRAARRSYDAGEFPACATGEHCRYCPSIRYCPAKGALLRAVCGDSLPEILQRARAREPFLTRENVAAVQARVGELEQLVRAMKGDIADFARQTPFRRQDGKVYGPSRTGRVTARRAPKIAAGR